MIEEFGIFRHVAGRFVVPKIEKVFTYLGHRIEWSPYGRWIQDRYPGYDFICNRCYERFFLPYNYELAVTGDYRIYRICELVFEAGTFKLRNWVFQLTNENEDMDRLKFEALGFLRPQYICKRFQVML